MNYLALTKRLGLEIDAGPGDPGTTPTTVTSQTGELLRRVTWINQAYEEIQQAKACWRWMIGTADGVDSIAIGASNFTPQGSDGTIDRILPYDPDGNQFILMYQLSIGVTDAQPVYLLPWEEFNGLYNSGQFDGTRGRPTYCAVDPQGDVAFFPTADVAYSPKYQYKGPIETLSTDSQTPTMPAKYHMLIVYLALCYYARSNEANRIQQWLGNGLGEGPPGSPLVKMYRDLCRDQMPQPTYFGNL